MSFWTPGNDLDSKSSLPRSNETPLADRSYLPDVEESFDHQALLLGTADEGIEADDDNGILDEDDFLLSDRGPRYQRGLLSPSAPPAAIHTTITSSTTTTTQPQSSSIPPPPPPQYQAPFETYAQDDRILSRDCKVNAFTQELYAFLQQRNTAPPKVLVRIKGISNAYEQYRRTYDSSGRQLTVEPVNTKPGSRLMHVDFDYRIDCRNWVSPVSDGFLVLPDRKTGRVKTVPELCEEYVRDTHRLKELQLTKVLEWDEDLLIRLLTAGIRAHGYSNDLQITVEKREAKVTVKPGSWIARVVDNVFVHWFCYITFLFILTWPLLLVWRKRIGHKTLQSKWKMTVTEKQWCAQHMPEILGQIPPAQCNPITITVHQ
ncbi:hypothetical protein BDB00DRAFT_795009 [Zychaea mexicana]|uniref:uncharacterized protein n=1 Tax=Zychaea mexicana TaxID=64656 RepID=UPI0022FE86E1|nr:uncharacterized protein BDB00DRAFT_795009 [Zychaea mexicana]KAI9499656.1 hypothetical protein BDB00DRAFT_795009 [Zychaea mexicana]